MTFLILLGLMRFFDFYKLRFSWFIRVGLYHENPCWK